MFHVLCSKFYRYALFFFPGNFGQNQESFGGWWEAHPILSMERRWCKSCLLHLTNFRLILGQADILVCCTKTHIERPSKTSLRPAIILLISYLYEFLRSKNCVCLVGFYVCVICQTRRYFRNTLFLGAYFQHIWWRSFTR